ncbi:MAG: murein biosynthesis integral membrane protein MurJ [Candidatus Paceibacterales bacterium]
MISRFFNYQTKTVTRAAGILVISALISRFLGVIRDWLLAKTFGAGVELDAYFTAFRIPDFVYNVFIVGGILVAFLPLFSEYFSKNKKEAWDFASNCLNIFLFLLIFLSFFLFILAPSLAKLIAPGFTLEQMALTTFLMRLMFLSPIFFGLSSILSGILQYFNRFLVYSLCPILYNLGIILGILFLAPKFGILGVALGVILGAFFHFAIQLPSALNCGFSYQPIFNFKSSKIKKVFILMIPRTFGMVANQINLLVINAIASTLTVGSIAILNFAGQLFLAPVGIIGISFAVAAFPALSKSWAEDRKDDFVGNFSLVFRQILYLAIPISILIFILRNQIVEIILRHGQFSLLAAKLTAASLGLFCFGIFAFSLIPLIYRAFFSFQDTKTPALISIVSMGFNIILSFFLTWSLAPSVKFWWGENLMRDIFPLQGIEDISVLGLPLAMSISLIFQFILSIFFLQKRIGDFKTKEVFNSFLKISIASIVMAGIIYFVFLSPLQAFFGVFWQAIIGGLVGVLVYIVATFLLKSPELETIKSSILRKFKK